MVSGEGIATPGLVRAIGSRSRFVRRVTLERSLDLVQTACTVRRRCYFRRPCRSGLYSRSYRGPSPPSGVTQVITWYGSMMSHVLQWTQFEKSICRRVPVGAALSSTML